PWSRRAPRRRRRSKWKQVRGFAWKTHGSRTRLPRRMQCSINRDSDRLRTHDYILASALLHNKSGTARRIRRPRDLALTGSSKPRVNCVTFGSHGVTIRPSGEIVTATWTINYFGRIHDEPQ